MFQQMRYLTLMLSLTLISCQRHGEEGHAHDAEGGHITHSSEIPAENYTIWTDKTELFVEFPALVVGKPSRFAAHFTVLKNHQPVREGSVSVSLEKAEPKISEMVNAPSFPGIFSPTLTPLSAGFYNLVFELETPEYQDKITIPNLRVFANVHDAIHELEDNEDEAGAISFLKEQAWKIEFQTTPVITGQVHDVIHTSGIWKYAPGSSKSLSANTTGVISFSKTNLTEGTEVKRGELLMSISSKGLTSNNLQTEIARAKANFERTKAEYERKKELYKSSIVPLAEFEQVEERFHVAKSNYETLTAGYGAGGKQIHAPFDGFVKSINIKNGDYVEQGTILLSIANQTSYILETQISPSYASQIEPIQNIWYETEPGSWSNIKETSGSILSVAKAVEKEKPMLSVFAQVNETVKMPEGSFTEVEITYGQAEEAAVIPVAALLEDYGRYSVIVQLSGESFERRPVQIGKQNGKLVAITKGLEPGEVVVTKGAYQVKMASMSGTTPAHGHDH